MKATPPVLPAFIPDAGAAAAATATQSVPSKSDGSPTFAGTLNEVGAKAGRKAVVAKSPAGESVPLAGNVTPPPQPPPAATKIAMPPADPAVPAPSSKMSKETSAGQSVSAAPVGLAATVTIQQSVAIVPTPKAPPSAVVGQSATPLPAAVGAMGAAAATAPDAALLPLDPAAAAVGAAAPQAPTAAATESGAAVSGTSAAAVGVGKSAAAAAATRPSFKAVFPHPAAAAPSAVDDSDDSDDSTSAASAAPPVAVPSADATSPSPPATDVSAAVALAALASSRSAYSAAAADSSDDSGAALTGAAAVAGASSLTDASMKGSAAATAAAVQATLLQGLARADKHTLGSVDAAGTGAAGAGAAVTAGGGDAAAGLSQLTPGGTAAPDAMPSPSVRVAANVDSAEFPQELSARVSWMVDNNLNGAKLQVNPPALGPIELRILVSGDHAQVWMSSHSAVTRDALENSTPKLREMLGTQGFSQVSVDISQRSFQERSAYSQPYEQTSTSGRSVAAATTVAGTTATRNSPGILDAYA